MWRVHRAVAPVAVIAGLALAVPPGPVPASAKPGTLRLTAAGDELGWISLTVHGRGTVDVRELTGSRHEAGSRIVLRDGKAEIPHAARWRCELRTRRFVATTRGAGARTAIATITTPSCADRLRMIVVPARLRPGQAASIRVTDTWHFGDIAATVCARRGDETTHCRRVRVRKGDRTRRTSMRLERPGPRTVALRTAFGQRLSASVDVRDDAPLRVLMTGDSMILGIFQALADELGTRASVTGDPHPGRGITTPGYLDWPAHARRSARAAHPDATVVFLGSADAGYPLVTPEGTTVDCCQRAWVAAYARRVSAMMAAYLRDGRSLVYWVLLPAPRSPAKAKVTLAENAGVRLAGAGYDDGVTVTEDVADVLAPQGRYRESIETHGGTQVVRAADGVHLTAAGILIATDIIRGALEGDGLLGQVARRARAVAAP